MRAPRALLVGVVAALGVAGASAAGALERFERLSLDLRHRARAEQPFPESVRVVAAADEDAETLGPWPWGREVQAQLLRCAQDAGARAVGFNLLFEEAGRTAEGDALFEQTVRGMGTVVLGAALEGEVSGDAARAPADLLARLSLPAPPGQRFPPARRVLLPPAALAASGRAVGFLDAPSDPDGTLRGVWLLVEHEGRLYPSLPLALLLAGDGSPLSAVRLDEPGCLRIERPGGRETVIPLDADGRALPELPCCPEGIPLRTYHETFYAYLQEGAAGLADLQGRLVLAGSALSGAGGAMDTPREQRMPGLLVQASVLAALEEGRFLRPASRGEGAAALLALCLLGGLAGARRAGWARRALGLLALLVPVAVGLAAFLLAAWVLPQAALLLGSALAFFGAMVVGDAGRRRQQQEVEGTFRRYLPPGVLHEVLRDPRRHLRSLERAEISMLRVRLLGWDDLRLAPEEEGSLLREFFAQVVEAVDAEQGTILHLSADGAFAIWNRPLPVAAAPEAAARAAFRLRTAVEALSVRWLDKGGAPVGIAAAVHSGLATVGTVGSEAHAHYTAFGREVAWAEHLLAQAGPGQVLASERAHSTVTTTYDSLLQEASAEGGRIFELLPPTA